MIDDGDPQAAVDYAAARGLDIAEVLKDDKYGRRLKVAGLTPTAEAVGEFEAEPAQPAPAAAPAEAQQATPARYDKPKIELRKRLAVLRALKECLA